MYLNLENVTPIQKLMGFPDLTLIIFFCEKRFNGLHLKQDFPIKWS